MRIFLTGFMGAGKSWTGTRLAHLLEVPFVDLDAEIEALTGMTISNIFTQHGEAAFRAIETETLREFAQDEAFVLSTGGGAPCFNDNMVWMNDRGTTVFLDPAIPVMLSRLEAGRAHRPLLKDARELEEFVRKMLDQRRPVYEQANLHIRYDNPELDVANLLLERLVARRVNQSVPN